jgi:hypothetical protein
MEWGPCTVGTNALLANGQCGPSGGSTIPGNIHQQIFSAGGGAATASNATLDAAGNSRTLSNDGLFNAFTAQTTPTSNNGIQNALTVTPGTTGYVVIGPDYASVEGIYGNGLCPNWRVAIGCPAPISNATALVDYRSGLYGTYNYNPNMGPGGSTWKYDRLVSNQQAQAAGTGNNFFPFLYDMELSGSGKNGFEGGGPDSWGWSQLNTEVMRRGIGSIHNDEGQLLSLGDYHVNQATFNVLRGSTDGSGEGFDVNRYDVKQGALTPMAATANATLAAGATLIQGTLVSNNPFPADGTPYIDATKGGPLFNITAVTPPSQPTAGTWTVDATLTPDNIGRTSVLVNTPTQYYGATTNETVTVTGLTSAIVTTSTVCYADPVYQESARVVSVGSFAGGTQSITVALRYVHQANAYVSQGSHACNFVEAKANQVPGTYPGRQLFRIIGVSASHTILYARTVFGNWDSAPEGFYSPAVVVGAGTTLTRNGSNVASVSATDPGLIFSGDGIIVSGCADASFNTTTNLLSDTGTVVTWSNPGPATTTTCTNSIELLSRMSATGVRQAQEFPGAEIVNTNDPTTFAINYNISVEPNTNFQVTAGDILENHVYNDVVMGFSNQLRDFQTQNSSSVSSIMNNYQISGEIPQGTIFERISFIDDPIHYLGKGGTKPIENTLYEFGGTITPFLNLWDNLPTPAGTAFSFNGYLYGCADARSTFTFLGMSMGTGFYREDFHQGSQYVQTTMKDNTSGAQYTKIESPVPTAGLNINEDNGVGGAGHLIDVLSIIPAQFENTVFSASSGSSHMIQTPTGWSIDVPMTAAAINSAAINTTGPVTVGGTGHSIATGTASNTDLTGEFAFSGGTTASYNWTGTYTSHPEVTLTPQATTATSGAPFVTYTGVTSFTINFPAAFTGSVTYTVIGRN